jgi:hypothetical protein
MAEQVFVTMTIDAELHSDQEALLLENGSAQRNLWGFNLQPASGNRSRRVDDPAVRSRIRGTVTLLVKR